MARGWESKSVEEQQSISSSTGSKPSEEMRPAAEIERDHNRRSLELQIIRVERQIANAGSERYREMLEKSLEELRKRISSL